MAGKSKALFMIIVLMIAGGCAGKPAISVEVYRTPTSHQALPEIPSPTTPAKQPTFLQPVERMPDFSPILYGKKYDAGTFFFLLGGVQGGQWIKPSETAEKISGTTEYDVYPFAKEMVQVLGYAPESTPVNPGQYFIKTEAMLDEFGMVGVVHGWPVRQTPGEELSADQEIYQQVVREWLLEAGLSDPQQGSMHIFRVDLEGDGVDEIFISATRLDDSQHTTREGDYSMVLMRKVDGNNAVTLPLVADIYRSEQTEITYPKTYSLANFIDLDKDGVLEVIVDYHRWEKDGALIYTINGQKPVQVP